MYLLAKYRRLGIYSLSPINILTIVFVDYTINKDVGRFKTLVAWMAKNKYHTGDIRFTMLKTPKVIVNALTTEQIRALLKACPTEAWRIRILISLCTGMWKTDVDRLRVANLSIIDMTITKPAQKIGKPIQAPLPDILESILVAYLKSLPKDQERLFTDVNVRKTWDSFRGEVTRQNLRQTFSTLIQKVGGIGSAQNLLQHFDSSTTLRFYTDIELILKWKVNQLPVKEWLNGS